MLRDYRKSRVYREARQDGIEEGKAAGKAKGKAEIIHRMASKGFDLKMISDVVGVEVKVVKKILKSPAP